MAGQFSLRFWGVRGTIPTPGTKMSRFGGNTSCVVAQCAGKEIILDAGTGIREYGQSMQTVDADILLSHTHLDHIMGFPFFMPAYFPATKLRIWAGHLEDGLRIREVFDRIMTSPIFPVSIDCLKSKIEFIEFEAGDEISPPGYADAGITVKTMPLNHPDKATAYRIEYNGKSLCYVTDVEHDAAKGQDKRLIEFIRGTDVFIYDSTYSDENYEKYVGWGHSTWQEGVRLADAADVGEFVVFHHDPSLTDDDLDRRLEQLLRVRSNSRIAKEGDIIRIA